MKDIKAELKVFKEPDMETYSVLHKGFVYRDLNLWAEKINCPLSTVEGYVKGYIDGKYTIDQLKRLDFTVDFNGKLLVGVLGFQKEFKITHIPSLMNHLMQYKPIAVARLLDLKNNPIYLYGKAIANTDRLRLACNQKMGAIAKHLETHSAQETLEYYGEHLKGGTHSVELIFPCSDGTNTYNTFEDLQDLVEVDRKTLKRCLRGGKTLKDGLELCKRFKDLDTVKKEREKEKVRERARERAREEAKKKGGWACY